MCYFISPSIYLTFLISIMSDTEPHAGHNMIILSVVFKNDNSVELSTNVKSIITIMEKS